MTYRAVLFAVSLGCMWIALGLNYLPRKYSPLTRLGDSLTIVHADCSQVVRDDLPSHCRASPCRSNFGE